MAKSTYTQEIADTICERIAGGETLRGICRDEGMPDKVTVLRWLRLHEDFRTHYTRAREDQADSWADEIVEIADERHPEDAARARLMIDARKWLMGKSDPKKYSDKIAHQHTGPNGGPIQVVDLSKLSDDQLAALEPVLAATAGSDGASGPGEGGEAEESE